MAAQQPHFLLINADFVYESAFFLGNPPGQLFPSGHVGK